MTETLSFPALGLDFDINRVAFNIPFLNQPVYWYGILIAAGILLGIVYFFKRIKAFGIDPDRSFDVLLWGILFSVAGARLYYVIFSWSEYKDNPISVFYIRNGGLAIYGAIITAVISGFILCKIRKVRFLPFIDLVAGSLFLGQAVGRWGNFTNVEAFGSNTTAPWGMTSRSISAYLMANAEALTAIGVKIDPSTPVHPTFLYESLWCLAGFAFIAWFTNRRRFDGQLILIYLGWYGLGRFFIEGLRTDSLLLGAIRVSQLFAMLCFIASAAIMIYVLSKIKREGDDSYLPLYITTNESSLVLSGEFYKKNSSKEEVEPENTEADTESTLQSTEADSPEADNENKKEGDSDNG